MTRPSSLGHLIMPDCTLRIPFGLNQLMKRIGSVPIIACTSPTSPDALRDIVKNSCWDMRIEDIQTEEDERQRIFNDLGTKVEKELKSVIKKSFRMPSDCHGLRKGLLHLFSNDMRFRATQQIIDPIALLQQISPPAYESTLETTMPLCLRIDTAVSALKLLTLEYNMEIAQEIGDHVLAFDRLEGWRKESKGYWKPGEFKVRERLRLHNRYASLGIAVRSSEDAILHITNALNHVHYPSVGSSAFAEFLKELNDMLDGGADAKDKVSDKIRGVTRDWLERESTRRVKTCSDINKQAIKENVKLQLAIGVVETLKKYIQAIQCKTLYAKVLAARVKSAGDQLRDYLPDYFDDGSELATRSESYCKATLCYDLAIELKRAIQRDGIRFQERYTNRQVSSDRLASWFDDQQRLDTQDAIFLSLEGDFPKARRRLNEAESSLVELHYSEGMELAVIELHRAAIFMQELSFNKKDSPKLPTAKFRETLLQSFVNKYSLLGPCSGESLSQAEFHSERTNTILAEADNSGEASASNGKREEDRNRALALIEDAWQALDRAEPIMKRHRKNAWWTTWYFELRMKLIEWQLFAVLESGREKSLPFIGTQATPRNFPTMLDALLDNSRRMIRMDVFRLARVVESYSNSLLALGLWRWDVLLNASSKSVAPAELIDLKHQARELLYREKMMQQWLINNPALRTKESPLTGIRDVLDRRLIYRLKLPSADKTSLSEDVNNYSKIVLKHSERVHGFSVANLEAMAEILGISNN